MNSTGMSQTKKDTLVGKLGTIEQLKFQLNFTLSLSHIQLL